MATKTVTGARATLSVANPNTGGYTGLTGYANNVSYSLNYSAEPIYILGNAAPEEIVYTAQEVVSISTSGWRVVDHGPHVEPGLPRLQDLLTHEYLELTIYDRQTNKQIAKFHSVRPVSFSTTLANRQAEEISVTFLAILVDDESGQNHERPDAAHLP